MNNIIVATFYHFTKYESPESLCQPLVEKLSSYNIKGTVLIAHEGINGTLAGSRIGIDSALKDLRSLPNTKGLEHKESHANNMPFFRLKVRLKSEIVSMKVPGVNPLLNVGKYVDPHDWNNLINDPDTIIIDARNNFEVEIGTFEGSINPNTHSFSELPKWLDENQPKMSGKKIAMFCTGGIRCEKATSYLKQKGINEVFHLKGGILQYLKDIPKEESHWKGECFVFDYRVSVKHGLEIGEYELCYACRWPLSSIDRLSKDFVAGISCSHCINQHTEKQRSRYAERQTQINLSKKRGERHIGANFNAIKKINGYN
tara:strand:+ start:10497 stop:11441 length:945 start_codon:yes stop_codon:yes gene_type:complete